MPRKRLFQRRTENAKDNTARFSHSRHWVVLGVIGLFISMYIGGNYAEDFVFNGVRGYEATGQIGFIIGGVIGLITGWWFLLKRKK